MNKRRTLIAVPFLLCGWTAIAAHAAPSAPPATPAKAVAPAPPPAPSADAQKAIAALPAPKNYDEWAKRVDDLMAGRIDLGIKDFRIADRDRKILLALAYESTAPLAPDAAKRYDAWTKAGLQWSGLNEDSASYAARVKARDVPGITPEQRRDAAHSAAVTLYWQTVRQPVGQRNFAASRADFEKFLALPDLTPSQKSNGLDFIGDGYMAEDKYLEAALAYEKAALIDPNFGFNIPLSAAEKSAPSPQILAVMNRLYPKAIVAQYYDSTVKGYVSPSAADLRKTKIRWAAAFQTKGDGKKATAIYTDLLAGAGETETYELQKKIAQGHLVAKDYSAALRKWDEIAGAPGAVYLKKKDRAFGRAAIFTEQGNFKSARSEFDALLADPSLNNSERAILGNRVATAWLDEAKAVEKAKGAPALVNASRTQAANLLDGVLLLKGVSSPDIYSTVVNRAQIAVDLRDFVKAHAILEQGRTSLSFSAYYVRQLWKLDSMIYRFTQDYGRAAAALYLGAVKDGVFGASSRPDESEKTLAGALLQEAFANKKWDDARAVVSVLDLWGLFPKESAVFRIQIDIASGQMEVARARLKKLREMTLTDPEKAQATALEKQLPPEVAGATPAVIPPSTPVPALTPPPAPVGKTTATFDDEDW